MSTIATNRISQARANAEALRTLAADQISPVPGDWGREVTEYHLQGVFNNGSVGQLDVEAAFAHLDIRQVPIEIALKIVALLSEGKLSENENDSNQP